MDRGLCSAASSTRVRIFFLSGRKMSWFPVGLNMTATLVSELRYTDTPAEALQVGLKPGTWPLTLWRHKGIVNQRQF